MSTAQNQQLTEQVSFRTTPELKMHYAEKAAQLGISLSEYLTLSLKEYERLKSQPQPTLVADQASQTAPAGENQPAISKIPEVLTDDQVTEKLDLILEMITDRLTPAAIDEVEKQNIINAARQAFTTEFQANNLAIATDASVPGGIEFKTLFNEILAFRIQKGKCTNALTLILDLIDHASDGGMVFSNGAVRKAREIWKVQKPSEKENAENEEY